MKISQSPFAGITDADGLERLDAAVVVAGQRHGGGGVDVLLTFGAVAIRLRTVASAATTLQDARED